MDEYIKRSTVMYYLDGIATADEMAMNIAKAAVKRIPAADVVEVVRCRECKHENVYHAISDKRTWCDYWGIDPDFDDFCSCGERRDSDGND